MANLLGSALISLSMTMLGFCQWSGYFPVSRPKYRVYRSQSPIYFWALVAGYALIGAIGVRILIAKV